MHQQHDYDGEVRRWEYQAGDLVPIHDVTLGWDRGTKLQFPWFGQALITKVLERRLVVAWCKREKPLLVVHVDRLEGLKREAWIVIDQRGCIAVNGGGVEGVQTIPGEKRNLPSWRGWTLWQFRRPNLELGGQGCTERTGTTQREVGGDGPHAQRNTGC